MQTALAVIIGVLILHVIQNDARLWQVVKELRELRTALDGKK